jgi:phosphoglycolate phosphatase-like HAD superfamily hydrolase
MKLFQFDFDGCMFDSLPPIYLSMRHVFAICGLTPPSLLTYLTEPRAPYADFYHKHGVTLSERGIHQAFHERMRHGPERWLFPDVVPQVKKLADKGHVLSIVSGNDEAVISRVLIKAGIYGAFEAIKGGVEHKTDAFASIAEKFRLHPKDSFVIGDSALDMDYGREAGMRPLGIIRYPHIMNGDTERLKQALIAAGAEKCIGSFAELSI